SIVHTAAAAGKAPTALHHVHAALRRVNATRWPPKRTIAHTAAAAGKAPTALRHAHAHRRVVNATRWPPDRSICTPQRRPERRRPPYVTCRPLSVGWSTQRVGHQSAASRTPQRRPGKRRPPYGTCTPNRR